MEKELTEHQKRIIKIESQLNNEYHELKEKREKLDEFIYENEDRVKVSQEYMDLLRLQSTTMIQYESILQMRIYQLRKEF